MLPRSQSLKKFSRNFSHTVSSPYFIVNSRLADTNKLIVTVPKKTCPLAVDRNRVRRIVVAAFLEISPFFTQKKEISILVRKDISQKNSPEVKTELEKLL
ncbi:ribonuclease P protein component [Candidatus Curtissbacteria bacterium]|nr:ribonuclease P protein component [Candidatus Curtissbacteria bacterium]